MLKLVCFVYLVDFVHLVSVIQPNKPNNGLLTLADFFSRLPIKESSFSCLYRYLQVASSTEIMTMQPRCRPRVTVGYPASIQSDTGAGEGVLLDLSSTGCRLRSNIAVNAGAYLALQIAVAQEPAPLAVEVSVVRWCKDGYFGVEFLRYSQGDRERVTNLVETLPLSAIPTLPAYATSTLIAVGS
jgi:hypothetical protein